MRGGRLLMVSLLLALFTLASQDRARGAAMAMAQSSEIVVTVDRTRAIGASRLAVGATHTQHSLDSWGDAAAVARGKTLLRGATRYQNQHIYGWGTVNPNPDRGVYDWRSLDRRIDLMRSMGAIPVITLCCAPDWMTSLGTATSKYPNIPPTPEHYADFADLARQVAQRYPDVKHYQVWNEMKGLWNRAANNWDYVQYTAMYNEVYDALKSVDPAIKVGGPYLVVEGTGSAEFGYSGWYAARPITARDLEVIDYWLKNKRGADFITIDRKIASKSHDPNNYSEAELMRLTRWYGEVVRQIRQRTDLPVWLAEDYFRASDNWQFQAAGLASMLYNHVLSGVAVSLRWGPQGNAESAHGGNEQALFSDTRVAGGGQPFPSYYVYKAFHEHFGPGAVLYAASSSSPDLEVLASATGTLLINKRTDPLGIILDGLPLQLGGYEVRLIPSAPARLFTDVDATNPFYPYIADLLSRGIVEGYPDDSFRWGEVATRGTLARWVVRAGGWPLDAGDTQHFADVGRGHHDYLYIQTAYRRGVLSGYAPTGCPDAAAPCFKPDAGLTRGQLAKIVVNATGLPIQSGGEPYFRDVPADNPFYAHVQAIQRLGLISGYDLGGGAYEFRWQNPLTRGQLSKVLAAALPLLAR